MSNLIIRSLVLCLTIPCSFMNSAADPQDFLPPILPWHGASEALVAKAANPWITPAEKTDLTNSPNYEDTVAYLKKLTAACRLFSLQEFGRTAQGRPLYLVIASKDHAFTPEALRASGKPALLAQGGIHSGEIDGKDAGLMLLRDIAFGGKESLLEKATLLFVPIFNADGHERASQWNRPNQRGPVDQGWRTTAQNLNLNRDYMKADSPEMQAMLRLINDWSPSLYLDLHVTDGIDYQYDITFGYNGDDGVFAWSPRIGAWLNDIYRPAMETALRAAGHIPGRLVFERDPRDLSKGFFSGVTMPRFSNGYGDLRHLASVLVENHSLKPYRQRVLGTYVLLESSLKTLGAHAAELRQATAADQKATSPSIPINWGSDGGGQSSRDFLGVNYETYTSPATGGPEVRWLGAPKLYPHLSVFLDNPAARLTRPKAYWVPVTKPEVIARLKLHGIQMELLPAVRTVQVEMYRLVNPLPAAGEGSHPYESRHTMKTGVKMESRSETFPSGSARVPVDQPLGDLAVVLLEPESADSLFAWGFFLESLQRTEYIEGYVLAPMAERMLKEDPKLKMEFEATLAADQQFAANPTARLQWFYQRSKFYDDRFLLYPVGMER